MGIQSREEKEIIRKIEDVYNSIIKKYIQKNNLYEGLELVHEFDYYPLPDDKNILFALSIDYIDIYFFDGVRWLIARFNEDGKLINVAWLDEYDELPINIPYKDYIYAYKRIKELGVMLV